MIDTRFVIAALKLCIVDSMLYIIPKFCMANTRFVFKKTRFDIAVNSFFAAIIPVINGQKVILGPAFKLMRGKNMFISAGKVAIKDGF